MSSWILRVDVRDDSDTPADHEIQSVGEAQRVSGHRCGVSDHGSATDVFIIAAACRAIEQNYLE